MPDDQGGTALVHQVLQLVGDLDIDTALSLISDDFTLEFPFRGDGGPRHLHGTDARSFLRAMPRLFTRLRFENVIVHGALPSGLVVAEYTSDGLTFRGDPYRNSYVAFFAVGQGCLTSWREYFDPTVVTEAFLV
jgi:ketosteroid isomerase-like protein